MFNCAVCGCKGSRTDLVDEVFNIEGEYVLVEHIPAEICTRCGEQSVSIETVEAVRLTVKGGDVPYRSVLMRVYEFEPTTSNIKAADAAIS